MLQETRRNADRTSTYIWRERDPISTYLVTVNVSGYVLLTDDYQGIPCTYYVFPEDQPKAEIDFQNVPDILGFYESVFAPYPFEKMGLAETMLGGAMENQDMIAYGRILLTGDLTYEPILAHEISHMYWGDSVTLTKCQDTWLNEGFASYCEPLWAEFWHGTDEYDATMAEFKMAYLTGGAADEPVGDPDEVWSATVYCKGAWVLHMLRYVIGEEAFWQVMPQYYAAFAYGHATTQDFQAVAETVHGAELEWFFDEWVYEPWHPEIGFGWTVIDSTPDTVTVEVGVDQVQTSGPMFRMPLELDIELSMGVLTHTFLMERASQRILFQLPEAPVSIRCDPREKVLKVFAETTFTPTPGATEPPTPPPTFSPTATATPTETAAATETPVPPTETPTPACGELGVTLRLAADRAQPGEEFWIAADVCVPEVPLRAAFVALLDLGINEYWC